MKIFSGIVQLLLIVTMPTAFAVPSDLFPICLKRIERKPIKIPDLNTLSYDEVVDLLQKIESGYLGDDPSREDVNRINEFLAFLAMEGVTDREKPTMISAIAELFHESDLEYASLSDLEVEYTLTPAIFSGTKDITLCKSKSWIKRQAKATRKFIKKHKKAIIIGAIVVVTVGVVVVTAVAISSAAAGSAIAAGSAALASGESLVSSLKEEISTFKENVAQEQFAAISGSNGVSIEDNGRIVGSIFAHKTVDTFSEKISENPALAQELTDLGFNTTFPTHIWSNNFITPHDSTDLAFSTDYASIPSWNGSNLNTISYQARGDWALSSGYYTQAAQDFSNAIERDPSNSIFFLGRGVANFELGQYDSCVADYNSYIAKTSPQEFSWTDFSLGFAKELPRGVYDSGEGLLLFLADLATHPFQTSKQVYESFENLSRLAKSCEWGSIGETLSPEVSRLVADWDVLSDRERGELSGYAFGKLGADMLIPGATAKIAKSGVAAAKELSTICKNLHIAQETLVLETAAGIGNNIKLAEVVRSGQTMLALGEEIGLDALEIAQLKQIGKLESTIHKGLEKIVSQSESDVLKTALTQNKHIKMVKDYLDKPAKEIQKGISSYEKLISLHKDKIINPAKYYPDWDRLDCRRREALVNKKWPIEVKIYQEQKQVLESILIERFSYEG